ncbi:MAG: 50S ribosomal subunit protein L10 [Candidatus Westeberhardia cardiocondylae]|nr:50S ribosomal subunit protein L10 [Candidatus Westeberhardia cardiocondylae]
MCNARKKKESLISEVKDMVCRALSVVIVNFSGVTACNMNKLRKMSRDVGVYIRVIRNTFIKRIFEDTQFDCLKDEIVGSTLVGLSFNSPNEAARLFLEYSEEDTNFKIVSASFEGRVFSPARIRLLAYLPTYEKGILVCVLTLKEVVLGKIIRVLLVLCDKKKFVNGM